MLLEQHITSSIMWFNHSKTTEAPGFTPEGVHRTAYGVHRTARGVHRTASGVHRTALGVHRTASACTALPPDFQAREAAPSDRGDLVPQPLVIYTVGVSCSGFLRLVLLQRPMAMVVSPMMVVSPCLLGSRTFVGFSLSVLEALSFFHSILPRLPPRRFLFRHRHRRLLPVAGARGVGRQHR